MQRQNNAPAVDLGEASFWDDLEEECIAALPPLHLRTHSEIDIFYACAVSNDDEMALQMSDASSDPDVGKEPALQEEATPSDNQSSKKRKRIHGQIGSREFKFLGIHNPLDEICRDANKKIQKELKLFGNTATKELDRNNPDSAKKVRIDEFKITLSK